MSANERVRLDAMHRVERDEVTVVSAAVLMCISLRQARRLWKRYRIEGAAGMTHRSRGRASNRRLE
ncbi:MAG: helix-turn-helix domain-containing protein, partial [Phycisphaerae bacterium]